MASHLRSFSRSAAGFLRSAAARSTTTSSSTASHSRSLHPMPRSAAGRRLGVVRSLQPLHSAVSAARLTSRLGAEEAGMARAMSQETGLSMPR